MMPDLTGRVTRFAERHELFAPGSRVVVGVSGGADSLVLLHVLNAICARWMLSLHVATLDHGLRGRAGAADAAFVRRVAGQWGLPVTVGRVDVRAAAEQPGAGLEEMARRVRYAFLLRIARQVGAQAVAVGHNRDDQAETVLMHLIRGSGLDGLCGMRPRSSLVGVQMVAETPFECDPPLAATSLPVETWPDLVRPLLDEPRAAIDAYVAEHGLRPREDQTNTDTTYARNRLRLEVLPLLANLNPNVGEALARTADVLREDADLVLAAGEAAFDRVIRATRPDGLILDRAAWAGLARGEKRQVIRMAVEILRGDWRDLLLDHVEKAIRVADSGATGGSATLPGGLTLRVEHDHLTLGVSGEAVLAVIPGQDAPALPAGAVGLVFGLREPVRWRAGAWTFEARPFSPEDVPDLAAIHADPLAAALAIPSDAEICLRSWRPGDRFQPRGLAGHSQKLADTFNALKVPAAWRARVPLLVVNAAVAWFVAPTRDGVRGRVGERFAVTETTPPTLIAGWRVVAPPKTGD